MEIQGLALLLFIALLFLSQISFRSTSPDANWLGLVGYGIGWFLQYIFGLTSYCVLLFFGWTGCRLLLHKEIHHYFLRLIYFCIALLSLCLLLSVVAEAFPSFAALFKPFVYSESVVVQASLVYKKVRYNLGGVPAYFIYRDFPLINLQKILSPLGTTIVTSMLFLISFLQLTKWRFAYMLDLLKKLTTPKTTTENKKEKRQEKGFLSFLWGKNNKKALFERAINIPTTPFEENPVRFNALQKSLLELKQFSSSSKETLLKADTKELDVYKAIKKELPKKSKREDALNAQRRVNGDLSTYELPPLSLLTDVKKFDTSILKKDLAKQAEVLEETLLSFGIEAKVGQIHCGPTITSFEVHPAIGVKVQKIKSLENDIALNLQAKSIRIIAPIPGKAAVGIEVPNPKPQEVSFKELIANYQQSTRKFQIPVFLGKTVSGEDVAADLAKMPHCIIAGATGSGKSVCINTIIMSILLTARPDEIKLLMVDPKKVELNAYTELPHLIAPVITEARGAAAALNFLVKEMEKRYEILKKVGARNIISFNERENKIALVDEGSSLEIPEKLPYIVAIIDELADLMMVSAEDIETPIARIAQMARAVGIHLILATQRPSREVITGLIKANFPTRIAFKVASRINSQIILDETGAESLLGNGDMLFLPPASSLLIRTQGAFIRDEDINKVISFIQEQAPPAYLIKSFDTMAPEELVIKKEDSSLDALYGQALGIIQETGNASTTFLQRKLKIGYARAASLMDQLEAQGVISEQEGSKPRKVLLFKGVLKQPTINDLPLDDCEEQCSTEF